MDIIKYNKYRYIYNFKTQNSKLKTQNSKKDTIFAFSKF